MPTRALPIDAPRFSPRAGAFAALGGEIFAGDGARRADAPPAGKTGGGGTGTPIGSVSTDLRNPGMPEALPTGAGAGLGLGFGFGTETDGAWAAAGAALPGAGLNTNLFTGALDREELSLGLAEEESGAGVAGAAVCGAGPVNGRCDAGGRLTLVFAAGDGCVVERGGRGATAWFVPEDGRRCVAIGIESLERRLVTRGLSASDCAGASASDEASLGPSLVGEPVNSLEKIPTRSKGLDAANHRGDGGL